jgi:hypothetical protein
MRIFSVLNALTIAGAALIGVNAQAAVDPSLLDLTPPDAKALYGVQVQQALASPFGQFAFAHMPDHGAALLQLAAATGFDVRRDLRELLLVSSTGGGAWSDGLVLARGTFQPAKFIDLARMVGATAGDYQGFTIMTPATGGRAFTFLDSSTVAIGNEAILRGIIDQRNSHTASGSPLGQKAQTASASADAWFATVTPLTDLVPGKLGPVPSGFIQAVIESSIGVQFTASGATLSAEALTHSSDEASALAGVFRFVAGMVKGPQAALLQSAQFTTNGPATRITLSVSEPDLEQAFPAAPRPRAAR